MARGTIVFDFLLLLTVSSVILSTNAKDASIFDRARKLIDINGFDVSSLMGGLQNSNGGDESPDFEDVAKNAPALMAMAGLRQNSEGGDSANSPGSSLEEDVAKNAPALLAGLASLQQNNAESPSDDSGPDLFEGLDNFRDSLNKGNDAASPAASPTPSPPKVQKATMAPSPQVSRVDKLAQSPSQSAVSPEGSTIAMAPSSGTGHTASAPSFGNGHIAVSPSSSVDEDDDDEAVAPGPGKGHGSVASSPSTGY